MSSRRLMAGCAAAFDASSGNSGNVAVPELHARGLDAETARRSSLTGRGSWWNAGASHMNLASPKRYFDHLGLFSFIDALVSVS